MTSINLLIGSIDAADRLKTINNNFICLHIIIDESIIKKELTCFIILLADSFTLVKIDDRYPDEWND